MANAALGPNLHSNPSFEQGEVGWALRSASLDSKVARTGTKSARMTGMDSTWNVMQTKGLSLVRGQRYLMSVWCRVSGEGKVSIGLRNVASPDQTIEYRWFEIPINEQENWFQFSCEVVTVTDPRADIFQVFFHLDQDFVGDVWFDDLSIQKIDEIPPNAPENVIVKRKKSVILSWTPPSPAIDGDIAEGGYNIYRADTPEISSSADYLVAQKIKETTWEDQQVGRQSYYYLITAIDELGNESQNDTPVYAPGVGSLSGKVRNEFGQPLKEVQLIIPEIDQVSTNEYGRYCFEAIPEGNHIVQVVKKGYRWTKANIEVFIDSNLTHDFILIEDETLPPPPNSVQIDNSEAGLLMLSWIIPPNLGDKQVAWYNIYRSESPDLAASKDFQIAEFVRALSWSDTSVISGKRYWYAVTLVDTALNESILTTPVVGIATPPPTPQLISPFTNLKIIDQPVNFKWTNLPDVDYYELEISMDEEFDHDAVLRIRDIAGNAYLYKRIIHYAENGKQKTVEIGLPDGRWYWRVRAVFKNGVQSAASEVYQLTSVNTKFSIDDPTPGEIVIEIPSKRVSPLAMPLFEISPPLLTKENNTIITFLVKAEEPVSGEVRIVDSTGRLVTSLSKGMIMPDLHRIRWDGTDDQGRPVRNGLYIVQVILNMNGQKMSSTSKIIVLR